MLDFNIFEEQHVCTQTYQVISNSSQIGKCIGQRHFCSLSKEDIIAIMIGCPQHTVMTEIVSTFKYFTVRCTEQHTTQTGH